MAKTGLPAISRRAFLFGSAAGALTFLGATHTNSGLVLAYADEAGKQSFAVVMLARDEIAVLAIDPSTSQVVPGMKVRVTTRVADAKTPSVELTTNEQGFATARVRDMAEDAADDEPVGGYGFWARVEASAEGYRDFAADLVRVQTGPAPQDDSGRRAASITVPTQRYDAASQPGYLRMLSFDGNDVQYSPATFIACTGNDVEHTLDVQVVAPAGKRVGARFFYDGAELASASGTTGEDGCAALQMKGAFLKDAAPDGETQLFFEIDGAQFEAPCRLSFSAGADGLSAGVVKEDAAISPGNPDSNPVKGDSTGKLGAYTVFIPEKFPIGGGTKFDLPLPDCPVAVKFNPLGMFAVGLGLDLKKLFPGPDGAADEDNSAWKVLKCESWEEYEDRKTNEQVEAVKRYDAAKAIKNGEGGSTSQRQFGGLDTKVDFSLMAQGTWTWGSATWSLGLNATILFNLKYSWGQQVFVGAVPAYVGYDIAWNNSASFYIGMAMDSGFENVRWTPNLNGVTIVSRIEIGVSAGVGIPGLLSVGARGYGFVQGTLGLVYTDNPFPHLALGAGAGITLVWQVLFASGTIGLYNQQWPHIYDNWGSGNAASLEARELSVPAAFANSAATYRLDAGEALDLAKYPPALIGADDLASLAEFDAQVSELLADDGSADASLAYGYLAQKETRAKFSDIGVVACDEAAGKGQAEDSEYLPSLGAVPAVDRLIYEGVTSDSRHKVVRGSDGSWYLCRLCVVALKTGPLAGANRRIAFNKETGLFERLDEPQTVLALDPHPSIVRPRVTISRLAENGVWEAPKVVDFSVADNPVDTIRANFYDYDFSVCEDLSNPGTFFFNVVSGLPGATGADDFAFRWRNQCVTFVKFRYEDARVRMQLSQAADLGTATSYAPHVFYHQNTQRPVFAWVSAQLQADGKSAVYSVNTRVYDNAMERECAWGSNLPYGRNAAPLYLDFRAGKGPRWTGEENRPAIVWVAPALAGQAPAANSYQVHLLAYDVKYEAIGWSTRTLENVTCPAIVSERGWVYTTTDDDYDGSGVDERTGELREIVFTTRTADSKEVTRQVGVANMTSFGAAGDGSRLFAVHCEEGELPSTLAQDLNPGADSEVLGVGEPRAAEQVGRYTVYAANWDDKRQSYHKFYPFCQSEHPLDVVDCVELGRGEASFIATEIVDAQAGKGNIYQVNVPLLCSVQLEAATTMDLFCGPGDTCHVTVRVQNNGNLPLKAFTVYLFDDGKDPLRKPLAQKTFDNLAACMCPATEQLQVVDDEGNVQRMPDEVYLAQKNAGSGALYGTFSSEDMNGLLWPGEERSYGTIDFEIPAAWAEKGEVEIFASVGKPVPDDDALSDALGQAAPDFGGAGQGSTGSAGAAGFGAVGSAASDDAGVFFDADGADESFTLDLSGEAVVDDVTPADYIPVNAAAAAADSVQEKSKAVDTGDSGDELIAPLVAIGAGAAAMAAYSKRRYDEERRAAQPARAASTAGGTGTPGAGSVPGMPGKARRA